MTHREDDPPALLMHLHFYRPFPLNANSGWVRPWTFIDDLSGQGVPMLPRGPGSVEDFRHYMPGLDDARFAQVFGQQALEYWLLRHGPASRYVGCSSYRCYLMIDGAWEQADGWFRGSAAPDLVARLSSDAQREAALGFLESADIITSRTRVLPYTIEQQYLGSQPAEYWSLFLEGIEALFPDYRRHMLWFRRYNCVSFGTTYIMRRELFQRYASEFFAALEYVFRHANPVLPDYPPGTYHLPPHRYPGFLGERFLPFFIYANALRKVEVPFVHLEDPQD